MIEFPKNGKNNANSCLELPSHASFSDNQQQLQGESLAVSQRIRIPLNDPKVFKQKVHLSQSLSELRSALKDDFDFDFSFVDNNKPVERVYESKIFVGKILQDLGFELLLSQLPKTEDCTPKSQIGKSEKKSWAPTPPPVYRQVAKNNPENPHPQAQMHQTLQITQVGELNDKNAVKKFDFYNVPKESISMKTIFLPEHQISPALVPAAVQVLEPWDIEMAKTVIFLGKIRSGKTTIINALANHSKRMKFESKSRIEITIDERPEAGLGNFPKTPDIRKYGMWISNGLAPLVVVDTPGFGFHDKPEERKKIDELLTQLANSHVDKVTLICLVIPCWQDKLTSLEGYLLERLLAIYGPQIMSQIAVVFSFSQLAKAQILSIDAKRRFSKFDRLFILNQKIAFSCDAFSVFRSNETNFEQNKVSWKDTEVFFENFTSTVLERPTLSIRLPRPQFIALRRAAAAVDMPNLLMWSVLKNLALCLNFWQFLNVNRKLLTRPSRHEFKVDVLTWKKIALVNGLFGIYCQKCHLNCIRICPESEREDLRGLITKNGACSICPLSCPEDRHLKIYVSYETRTATQIFDLNGLCDSYFFEDDSTSLDHGILEQLRLEVAALKSTLFVIADWLRLTTLSFLEQKSPNSQHSISLTSLLENFKLRLESQGAQQHENEIKILTSAISEYQAEFYSTAGTGLAQMWREQQLKFKLANSISRLKHKGKKMLFFGMFSKIFEDSGTGLRSVLS